MAMIMLSSDALRKRASLGKKAVFFTLISIMIIIMFIYYFEMQIDIPMKQKTEVIGERVTNLNNFVESFEGVYAPRALYAISHRALGGIILNLNDTNNKGVPKPIKAFSRNISEDFRSAIIKGQMANGAGLNEMHGNTMLDWLDKLTNVSRKEMNIEFAFTINGISLKQDYNTGPWKARAEMDISYWVASAGVANWSRNNSIVNATFDVSGFIDPYILTMSDGYLAREINITDVTADRITSLEQFKSLIRGGAYLFENSTAPSFLYRFEGNTSSSSCCGIESFVTPDQAYPSGAGDADSYGNSYIDFEFWSGRCFNEETLAQETALWNATIIYLEFGYFKLDSYHRFKDYPNTGADYMEAGGVYGLNCQPRT